MLPVIVVVGAILCAAAALFARQLLASSLWLAGASALTAVMLYMLGAPEAAVIELSVGAGLVTVLFVFAINIAGEDVPDTHPVIPRPLGYVLSGLAFILLAAVTLPRLPLASAVPLAQKFTEVFWQQRGLDTLLQAALIFCGVMAILTLLAERSETSVLKKRLQ